MKSYWAGVAAALGIGGIIGFVGGGLALDRTLRKEYDESTRMMQRAYERALNGDIEPVAPEESEEMVIAPEDGTMMTNQVNTFGGKIEGGYKPMAENPYHKAISATETPVDLFVDGGMNQYGISYLEEEEYQEDDGRLKTQVSLILDNGDPLFFIDGEQIDDWDQRLGDSIVVDFFNLAPMGTSQVLYVRNHRTEEDYEVILETP